MKRFFYYESSLLNIFDYFYVLLLCIINSLLCSHTFLFLNKKELEKNVFFPDSSKVFSEIVFRQAICLIQ